MHIHQKYIDRLEELEKIKNLRVLPKKAPINLVNLSSNDYLALNSNIELLQEFIQTVNWQRISLSASSTRLLTGNIDEYEEVENKLAQLFKRDACLVFNSGYHANMGILPALTDKKDLVIADKAVHASLIDGMRLSEASTFRYNHMNLEHLEHYLAKERHNFENVFIATESIFSMDGMRTDLRKLVELKHKYNAFLYLDEAHAFGVCGTKGLGCADELNLIDEIDIIVGTFGKALASIGAFAVCDDIIRKFLVNKSRSLIYTTGLPPLNLAWTSFILNKLTDFEPQRKIVNQTWKCFSDKLNIKAESHIIPYILGNNEDVIDFAGYMQKNGFYVLPIRHPTVPIGTARIRFSINAAVTPEQLEPIFDLFYKFSPKNK